MALKSILHKSRSIIHCAFIPIVLADGTITADVTGEQIEETGWDRICAIFKTEKYSTTTREFQMMLMAPQNGFILGGIFGAFIFSRNEYVHYIATHEASKYDSHLKAKEQLTNRLSLGLARGAFGWGFRVAALCFLWTSIVQLISAYRNEISWIEHSIGGATVGALTGHFSKNFEALGLEPSMATRNLYFGTRYTPIALAVIGIGIGNIVAIMKRDVMNHSKSTKK